jgi:hypothetical protein
MAFIQVNPQVNPHATSAIGGSDSNAPAQPVNGQLAGQTVSVSSAGGPPPPPPKLSAPPPPPLAKPLGTTQPVKTTGSEFPIEIADAQQFKAGNAHFNALQKFHDAVTHCAMNGMQGVTNDADREKLSSEIQSVCDKGLASAKADLENYTKDVLNSSLSGPAKYMLISQASAMVTDAMEASNQPSMVTKEGRVVMNDQSKLSGKHADAYENAKGMYDGTLKGEDLQKATAKSYAYTIFFQPFPEGNNRTSAAFR